ncbi:MAG: caspase family protein, partial [Thermodesulfobacteriota bacterium]|nr:caspase family protein [Thermodesulfobacteriota bacterium]
MTFFKSTIIAVSILFVLLWASLINEGLSAISEKKVYKTGENHALIIGINGYNHWPKLKSPVKDAEEIAKILTDKYNFKKKNIVLLTDKTREKPTLTNILTSLENYLGKLTEKDNLLVFFSGHSSEDDAGETYWIPKNGKKKTKMTWLGHSDLCSEYFASEKFKVKHLCIITDSLFTKKLIKSKAISLTPYDLRYVEKIIEKATKGSREVISFGDQHWPGSKNTDGLGLFTYYIRKALLDNQLEVIDFENLIFEENIIFPIRKIAGTKMLRGRLKTPMEKGGQYIITKIIPSPLINVVGLDVSPEKGYPGDSFILQAKTNAPANEVYVEIAGQKHLMKGDGIDWKYSLKIDRLGSTNFNVTAINRNDLEGKPKPGQITTVKRRAKITNIQQVAVNPKKGFGGDKYRFTVTTDAPASKVALIIKGREVQMKGSGVDWFLSKTIEDIGTVNFSAIAINEDGIQGLAKKGTVQIKAGPVNVAELIATPKTGYAGEEFMITAKTDRFASSVSLRIDGKLYPMKGSGKIWEYKKKIPDIGKKQFTVIAKNIKGDTGISKSGVILTRKSPLPIPDVIAADVRIVSPGKGYAGD